MATTTARRTGSSRAPARRSSTAQTGTSTPARTRQSYYAGPGRQSFSAGDTSVSRRGGRLDVSTPGRQVTVAAPTRTYHRIILVEFLGCVILVTAAPILNPKTSGKGAQLAVDTSVSFAGPLVRLTAVCVVFFVLALMGNGQRTGKIAAAFGGLVLLGCVLTAHDIFAGLAAAFGPAVKGAGSPGSPLVAQGKKTASQAQGIADAAANALPVLPTPGGNPIPGNLAEAG